MQIVYISKRPEVFAETLDHVTHHMPWVDDVVVVAPERSLDRYQLDLSIPITAVSDEMVVGNQHTLLRSVDHSSKNIMIRKGMLKHGLVDDEFILSDDDYRPLKPVDPSFFVEDGKYHGYYSYDLAAWRWSNTDFDRAQHLTHQALVYLGCPRYSYGAHMPQVMARDVLQEAFEAVERFTASHALCEWSLYFNYGRAMYPERFHAPRIFCTLGWPEYPGSWPFHVRPAEYVFENFYPQLYESGNLFGDLPTTFDPVAGERHNFEKIMRWYELELAAARLDFPSEVADPWTKGSRSRRAAFSLLRRARKVVGYLTLEERTRLAELAGTVERMRAQLESDAIDRQ